MKRILITGGSGLLGGNIAKMAVSKFDVYATYHQNKVNLRGVNYFQIDISKAEDISKIEDIRPDYIIHCAALTDLDYCQEHIDLAYRYNVIASINIAEIAKKLKAGLIHISTDSLFDGKKGDYTETDLPNPINIYAKTKLESEIKVLSIYPDACVVRTNIYGWNMRDKFSLAEWMLDTLLKKDKLKGLKDVYFASTFVNDLIGILFKLQEIRYKGIIHVAGSQGCSKLNFAYKIAEVFSLDKKLIKSISLADIGFFTPRPKNTILNVSKCQELLGIKFPNVEEGLKNMKALEGKGYVDELKGGR